MLKQINQPDIKRYLCDNKDSIKKLNSFTYLNESYNVNDNIVLSLYDAKKKSATYFAKLLSVIIIPETEGKNIMPLLEVQFYFSREHLDCRYKTTIDHISISELFLSDLIEFTALNSLIGKFKLYGLEDYISSLEDQDIKFCQATIDTHTGNISPKLESRKKICYCKKIENPDFNYILCESCDQWFHYFCVGIQETVNVTNIHFKCKNCELNSNN